MFNAAIALFDTFNLMAPITLDELKSRYRERAKALHPDLNKHDPKASEKFVTMNEVYNKLLNAPGIFQSGTTERFQERTISGELLTELGLGVGRLKNGRDCEECNHKGYIPYKRIGLYGNLRCPLCYGVGIVYFQQCGACNGSGSFTKGDKTKAQCTRCNGEGKRTSDKSFKCYMCSGFGNISDKNDKALWQLCYHCMGVGEIEIFNPVIPKGILVGSWRGR